MILLPNQFTPRSLHFAAEQQAQILFSGLPVVDLCTLLSLSHSPALLDTRRGERAPNWITVTPSESVIPSTNGSALG